MNKKIIQKLIISILVISIACSAIISLSSLAGEGGFPMFEPDAESSNEEINEKVTNLATTAVVTVRIITFAIAMVILLVIAMRYMISAPNDRADIKKHAVPYVIGVLILFGTSGVLTIIQKVAKVFDE